MTEGRRSGRAEIRTERKEERENMKKRWITQSEYAARYGISRQAVSKAVKVGRLQRMDGKVDGNVDITTEQAKGKQDNEIVTLRKEKLEIEKELAAMKLERAREEIRKDAIAEFIAMLHRKYEHVRKGLADLSLSPAQVEKLERLLNEYDAGITDLQQT